MRVDLVFSALALSLGEPCRPWGRDSQFPFRKKRVSLLPQLRDKPGEALVSEKILHGKDIITKEIT